jgi:hypothetical protein
MPVTLRQEWGSRVRSTRLAVGLATLAVALVGTKSLDLYHRPPAAFQHAALPANHPITLTVDMQRHRAFVLNAGDDSLSVVDTLHGTVLNTIPGSGNALGLAAPGPAAPVEDERSGHLFVPDGSRLKVIDAQSGRSPLLEAAEGVTSSPAILLARPRPDHALDLTRRQVQRPYPPTPPPSWS